MFHVLFNLCIDPGLAISPRFCFIFSYFFSSSPFNIFNIRDVVTKPMSVYTFHECLTVRDRWDPNDF